MQLTVMLALGPTGDRGPSCRPVAHRNPGALAVALNHARKGWAAGLANATGG
jgi:hypothetical protein